ncbi:hypothetical protein [Micromonospora sp. NPDC047074]|uniref:hypothetical protein n=1 Tax=Micromonospora sp. NPDC047074 TaxID=3154339 RepID=UPI0033DA7C8E
MSVTDPEPVWIALRLVIVVVNLGMIGVGVRVAVSRRFPARWVRAVRLPRKQRSQPVRIGGGQALVGACLLFQQAPFLVPMPHLLGRALFGLALFFAVTAMAWHVLLRSEGPRRVP